MKLLPMAIRVSYCQREGNRGSVACHFIASPIRRRVLGRWHTRQISRLCCNRIFCCFFAFRDVGARTARPARSRAGCPPRSCGGRTLSPGAMRLRRSQPCGLSPPIRESIPSVIRLGVELKRMAAARYVANLPMRSSLSLWPRRQSGTDGR